MLACRTDVVDELPDHDYDYISAFQERHLDISAGNPEPSTAGGDASEVKFELTSCEAYGHQPSTAGDNASEVGFELTPCEADGHQPSTAVDNASEVGFELTAYGPATVPMHDDN